MSVKDNYDYDMTSRWEECWDAAPDLYIPFKALKLKADVYPSRLMDGIDVPKFDEYDGRVAGRMRSVYLDQWEDDWIGTCQDISPALILN